MARKYVKETEAVRNLNAELKEQQKLINSLDNTYADLAVEIMSVAEGHEKSTKYSKENLDLAKQQSKVGSAMLNVLDKENKGGKLGSLMAKTKLGITRMLDDKNDEITQNLFEQYDIAKEIMGLKEDEEVKTNKLAENMDKITDALSAQLPFGSEISKLFSQKAKMTAKVGAALAIAVGILKKFSDMTKVIGDNFGAIGMTTSEIKDGLLGAGVEATRLGFGMEDVASVVNELTNNFGFSLEESIKLSSSILDTSKALGMSVSEGTQLIGTLSQVVGLSTEASTQFAKQTALLAKQSGVAPNVVMKDIAASAETTSKFFAGGGENIAKAAIMATKLGTNLDTVGKVAEGLLDFQSSLNKEIEASIILGKDFNFQKARELALNNDIEGAMAEIVGQLGSEEEFNKLNAIERQAMADAINVSTSELAKFVSNQDKALTLTESIAAQPGFEDLVGRDALDNITKIVQDFKTIGATLITSVGPMLSSIVGGMASFTKWISESKTGMTLLALAAGAVATAMMISAVASIWAQMGKLGPAGIILGGLATGAFFSQVSQAKAIPKAHDLEPGKIASVTSGELLTDSSEATVKKESLSDMSKGTELRLDKLISLMETAPKKTGASIHSNIITSIT